MKQELDTAFINPRRCGPGTQAGQVVYLTAKAWMPYRLQAKVKQELNTAFINPRR
jgi:hypothetical protein